MIAVLKKNLKWIILGLVIIVGLVAGGRYAYRYFRGQYAGIKVTAEVSVSDPEPFYVSGEGKLLYCTQNGLKAYGSDGKVKVDASYEMEDPIAAVCGDYIAVASAGGKEVQVIPGNGVVYRYFVTHPINKLCVARQGVSAVMLDAGTEDIIEVRDKEGKVKVQIGTDTRQDGIPVDMALSPDGKKLVSMYVSFDGDEIVSKVTFYNMSDVGKNYVDNIVGQFKFPGELVWSVSFLGNDTVGVMLSTGFKLFSMKEIPDSLAEVKPDGAIIDAAMNGSGISVVVEKDGVKSLKLYDLKGSLTRTINDVRDYKHMYLGSKEVVLLGSRNLSIYRFNGTCKLDMELTQSIDSIFFGDKNSYYFVSPGKIKMVKVK